VDAAVRLKSIIPCHLGLVRVGMAEASGQFVAVDLDIMLSGQRLKFGESRWSSQWMRYGKRHDGKAKGQWLKAKALFSFSTEGKRARRILNFSLCVLFSAVKLPASNRWQEPYFSQSTVTPSFVVARSGSARKSGTASSSSRTMGLKMVKFSPGIKSLITPSFLRRANDFLRP